MGKSKELHCCVGPGYDTLEWYKDDAQFPWETTQGEERNAILYRWARMVLLGYYLDLIMYSNNQSLIMMEVRPGDSGQYKCVAR